MKTAAESVISSVRLFTDHPLSESQVNVILVESLHHIATLRVDMLLSRILVLPSPIYLLAVAAGNAFILLASGYEFFSRHQKEHTWINKDFPIRMPVGDIPAVEMTFQESYRFGLSHPDSKLNWETLFNTNSFGLGVQHLGPYHFRYVTSAYHSLHCLYTMRKDLDASDHIDNPNFHFVHCITYLRQIFLCNADMSLEDGDFMMRNFTMDRVGQTRKCRDWGKVSAWVNENNKEWLEYNGVTLD